MSLQLQPLQMLLLMCAGWVNRHQLDVIQYLQEENRDLVLQMTLENPSSGYTRIRGALTNLGHQVGRATIANILRDNRIEPAPEWEAHTRWSTFLEAHWESLTATDFMSVAEVERRVYPPGRGVILATQYGR
jgi:hypothetical protein